MSFDPPGKKKSLPLSAENAPTIIRPSALQYQHDVEEAANSRNGHPTAENSQISADWTRQSHQQHKKWGDEIRPTLTEAQDVDKRQHEEEKEEESPSQYDLEMASETHPHEQQDRSDIITIASSVAEPKIRVLGIVKPGMTDDDDDPAAVRESIDPEQQAHVPVVVNTEKSKTDYDGPAAVREAIDPSVDNPSYTVVEELHRKILESTIRTSAEEEEQRKIADSTSNTMQGEERGKINRFCSWNSKRTKIAVGLLGVVLMLGILYVVYFLFVL